MINVELKKLTDNTITDIEAFKNQLKEIKQQGIAYDHGEASEDVHAVSAPVFNQAGKAVASTSICVPSNRVNKILNSKIVAELRETAKRISGYLY